VIPQANPKALLYRVPLAKFSSTIETKSNEERRERLLVRL